MADGGHIILTLLAPRHGFLGIGHCALDTETFQLCRGLSTNNGLLHVCLPVDESNCEIRAEPTLLGAKLAIRRTIRVSDDLEGASKGAISYSSSGGLASGP